MDKEQVAAILSEIGTLLELKGENAGLREKVQRASDPLTLEREARKLGMVKPGERAYVIEGLGD